MQTVVLNELSGGFGSLVQWPSLQGFRVQGSGAQDLGFLGVPGRIGMSELEQSFMHPTKT